MAFDRPFGSSRVTTGQRPVVVPTRQRVEGLTARTMGALRLEAWYAVHAKARQEHLALEHLRRQHYASYLPLIRLHKRRRSGWEEVTEPLFPGYLFVRLDTRRDNTAPIRSTRGVIGLVRFGGSLRPVPEGLVEQLLAAPADPEGAIREAHLFQAGDRVEIVVGPLAGLQAIFLAPTGQQRAHLLLELMGRETRVVVPQERLIPSG